jgi:hypothetical protein
MAKRSSRQKPKARDSGYRLTDWLTGYRAGTKGEPNDPPPNTNPPSWTAGYLEGHAHIRAADLVATATGEPGACRGLGTKPYCSGFVAGVLYATKAAGKGTPLRL